MKTFQDQTTYTPLRMFHFPTRDISIAEMGIYAPLKPTAKKKIFKEE